MAWDSSADRSATSLTGAEVFMAAIPCMLYACCRYWSGAAVKLSSSGVINADDSQSDQASCSRQALEKLEPGMYCIPLPIKQGVCSLTVRAILMQLE